MTFDLLHNKIIKETVSERFSECIKDELTHKLESLYGDELLGIQMYEDYINDNFLKEGFWYYPLSVILKSGVETLWIKWQTSAKNFKDGVPYSFVGDKLEFLIADYVPETFIAALSGRSNYFEGGYVKVNVHTTAQNPTFLSGKYSQTFIDEMTRQISAEICRACGVSGIEKSTVEIDVVFTPETYMEHTSENVTYRRLLMSAKGCAARDFWIKWTRLNSSVAYSVKDNVSARDIVFEIGEDVSHKIREKEYRFLVYGNSDKYRAAMGRKNITEWRELIKRAVKRGELEKTFTDAEVTDRASLVSDKLSEILEKCGVGKVSSFDGQAESANVSAANEALLAALANAQEETLAHESKAGYDEEFSLPSELELTLDDISEEPVSSYDTEVNTASEFDIPMEDASMTDMELTDEAEQLDKKEQALRLEIEQARRRLEDERLAMENARRALEEQRAAMEAERERLASEARARQLAEAEANRLRAEQENLIRENQRLEEQTRLAEQTREREEAARREQEEKLREQIMLEAREKAREKMLFAEAARLAREEHERLSAERAEADAVKAAEQARIDELRREQELRFAAEERVRIERERIESQARARAEDDVRRRADVSARAAEAMANMQREARLNAESRAASSNEYARVEPSIVSGRPASPVSAAKNYAEEAHAVQRVSAPVPAYTYTSKLVRLMFRRNIDPNVTSRIHEMISIALSHYGKEDVYIKVKASIPDSSTVILNFVKIPEEELDLLVDIIKFLGNSDLGIYKVILE